MRTQNFSSFASILLSHYLHLLSRQRTNLKKSKTIIYFQGGGCDPGETVPMELAK